MKHSTATKNKLVEHLRSLEMRDMKAPSDADLMAYLDYDSEADVRSILADLSDEVRIKIIRQGGGRTITVYADRGDDSDEISRRIAAATPSPFAPRREVAMTDAAPAAPAAPKVPKAPAPPRGVAVPRKFAPPLGSRPSIEWVHVERLSVDATYQRSTDNDASRRLIASIAAGFDWRLCSLLVVSRRPDGTFMVIDGQHRMMAARRRGDIDQLPCCVYNYESAEEEARMFIVANRSRKAMNRLDDFHAALAADDGEAITIKRVIDQAGLAITRNTASASWKPREIAFTSSISTTIRRHGEAVAQDALMLIAEAFPEDRLGHGGSIFGGLVKIVSRPPHGFDRDRLLAALKTFSADGWGDFVQGLKGGDTRALAMRAAIMEAYGEPVAE